MSQGPVELYGSSLPPSFLTMARPPERAWLWGSLPPGPTVAVVGTRKPSEQGLRSTQVFARELAERGVVIASGGALGIDAAAHLAALDAGGRTLVFAPAWLDHAYPKQNRALFERVLERGGAYLSLSAPGKPTRPHAFYRRNEALAAYCLSLVVAQCGYKSGTKNAAQHARRLGRAVFVLPSAYGDERGVGSNALVAEGCGIVVSAESFLRAAIPDGVAGVVAAEADPVLAALLLGAQTLDEVVRQTRLSVQIVQHRLLLLTLEGRLEEDGRGLLRYQPGR